MKTRFDSLTPRLIAQRQQVHEICRQFGRSPSKGNLKRLKQLFKTCGEQVVIESGFYCDYGDKISLGDRVFININCTILDGGQVVLGDDCLVGPNVQLMAVSHDTDPALRLEKHNYAQDITIGKNVWLGAGVIIIGGINIGDNSVIGAGSVVTKDVESGYLYAGNPARKIKKL
ncbi:sugar O-acetyltransferase [Thalassomonas viridans]|uniref:Nodulation protein L n=1 Tax=Thalassomonas viridans TaxID=137584 RepID=A0AAE9Z5U3_9GAMM|nr:sugar O-acetyltransferase [Thalassomonas viridans]WDE07158.1 sugar O-acetyltransferase [Thalassomonas viridans]